nr:MAG: RNA-dependent RNA polymerase [Tuatara cloaca-associated tombusvirus-1]
MEVRTIQGNPVKLRYTYMVGAEMSPDRNIYAFNSTISNLLKAVKERVFYVKDADGNFVRPPLPAVRPVFKVDRWEAVSLSDDQCVICKDSFGEGNICVRLPCSHLYHYRCIKEWVEVLAGHGAPGSCPMCTRELDATWDQQRDHGIYRDRLGKIQQQVIERCPKLSPLELEEFPLQYVGKQRTRYMAAVESLGVKGLKRSDAYTSNFTKTERTLKANAVPRNISPRSYRYNAQVGRLLKPAEGVLLDAIAKLLNSKTVMKGLNASQVGAEFQRKWEKMGGDGVAAAIGLDASRFDQHVSVEALQWEHEFYYSICSDPVYRKQLRKWLSWQLLNKGYGNCRDGSLTYEVAGTRCSGDMNTGMGNCLIASCLLIAYCRDRHVDFELANNGDDCVIFLRKRDISKFSRGLSHWFTEMGFNMVVEDPVYQLERVVFCQAQPVFDGYSWTMVRDPRTSIAKDCVSLKPWRNEAEYTAWIKCVGMSGTSLAGGIPILDSFYRSFVRAGGNAKPLSLTDPTLTGGLFWASKGMNRRGFLVSDDARVSFFVAFGITPDEQICLEEEYNSTTPYYQPVEFDPPSLPVKQHTLL